MSGTEAHITERRTFVIAGLRWAVNVFDDGRRYMLTATTSDGAVQFSVHFDAQQWAEFQKLVSP